MAPGIADRSSDQLSKKHEVGGRHWPLHIVSLGPEISFKMPDPSTTRPGLEGGLGFQILFGFGVY